MSPFESELLKRLDELQQQNLLRKLRCISSPQQPRVLVDGKELINFSSNDYLGLATNPRLKAAALESVERYGTGSGASRLVSGSLQPHHELEQAIATFKRTAAALVFSTGYATALGTITALVGKEDIVVVDKLVHASIVDAAHLSGATLRVFHHNDPNDLESILRWANAQRSNKGNVLIVTESLFSMDGDIAPLAEIVALKEQYGAWLMLDEAHATGLFGPGLRGLAEEMNVADHVEIQMGTLGKALGSAGGYIAGSRALIDYLLNRSRSFIFSTAPPPSASAAAAAALQLIQSAEGTDLVQKLRTNIRCLKESGIPGPASHSPILPLIIGSETEALRVADELREAGVYVPAIRFPTVARGKARLRFTVSSAHTESDIQAATAALQTALRSASL